MGVSSGLYMYDVVVIRSRSLSHLLMSSCWFFSLFFRFCAVRYKAGHRIVSYRIVFSDFVHQAAEAVIQTDQTQSWSTSRDPFIQDTVSRRTNQPRRDICRHHAVYRFRLQHSARLPCIIFADLFFFKRKRLSAEDIRNIAQVKLDRHTDFKLDV